MIIVSIICLILIIILIKILQWDDEYNYSDFACWLIPTIIVTILIFIISLLSCIKFNISSSYNTGYLYQRTETFGYARYSIRYSQNAGQDTQNDICVKANSKEDLEMSKYVGIDTKVSITIKAHKLFLANNPFTCRYEAKLDKGVK